VAQTLAQIPQFLSILVSAGFIGVLGIYSLRRRMSPGAVPLFILAIWTLLFVLLNGIALVRPDDAARILGFKLESVLLLPMMIAALFFVLEYSGLGRWATRRTVALSAVPPIVFALLAMTNGAHHLLWKRIWIEGKVRVALGPADWAAIAIGALLALIYISVLARLFVRSPRHRVTAAGLILGLFVIWGAFVLRLANWNPVEPLDPIVVALDIALIPYAFAVFRFRLFDIVPIARDTVIEQMGLCMMVLDPEDRLADLNGPMETLLGERKSTLIGKRIADVLPSLRLPPFRAAAADDGEFETTFGDAPPLWFQARVTPLVDRRGFRLGRLVTLHDITQRKRAQAQILDQQTTLGMLKERELLARELHDGIGQMIVAARLQAAAAGESLGKGDLVSVGSCLTALSRMTEEATETIREYLGGVKSDISGGPGFFEVLRRHLDKFGRDSGIRTELFAPSEMVEERMAAAVEAQVQLIIREALANARRHSGARSVRVTFVASGDRMRVTVEDDGRGFDPGALGETKGFGLRSMRGRAEAAGGRLELRSAPGKGTEVVVWLPRAGGEQ
jgi:PAS domain S-box-containing protein